jgi:hypothetical protein
MSDLSDYTLVICELQKLSTMYCLRPRRRLSSDMERAPRTDSSATRLGPATLKEDRRYSRRQLFANAAIAASRATSFANLSFLAVTVFLVVGLDSLLKLWRPNCLGNRGNPWRP